MGLWNDLKCVSSLFYVYFHLLAQQAIQSLRPFKCSDNVNRYQPARIKAFELAQKSQISEHAQYCSQHNFCMPRAAFIYIRPLTTALAITFRPDS